MAKKRNESVSVNTKINIATTITSIRQHLLKVRDGPRTFFWSRTGHIKENTHSFDGWFSGAHDRNDDFIEIYFKF